MKPISIDFPPSFADGIDSQKNGFIGASAGTGKTHTIVYLVLKLLRESFLAWDADAGTSPPPGIDSILVLTYTDKAASELRSRIRAGIKERIRSLEEAARTNPILEPERQFFLAQAERLDQAYISTIHGFCSKILKEYSLETGYPANAKLVSESEPLNRILYSRMHSEFAGEIPKESIALTLLKLRNFFDNGFTGNTWEDFISELAGKKEISPSNVRLIPRPNPLPGKNEIHLSIQTLSNEYSAILPLQELLLKYVHASTKKAFLDRELAFKKILAQALSAIEPFDPFKVTKAILEIGRLKRKESGVSSVLFSDDELKKGESDPAYATYVAQREKVKKALSDLETIAVSFVVQISETIVKQTPFEKAEEGEITYNDMIRNLSRSLITNQVLLTELRTRFHYAIVDEFQDTDSEQYGIFRNLFLEKSGITDSETRLFLIGDSKQGIYGFRGADIGTYLSAKNNLDLNGKFADRSVVYPALDTNRRSLPELISAYNDLFSAPEGDWFPLREPGFDPIPYEKVNAAPFGRKAVLYSDRSERGALNAFQLPSASSKEALRDPYAKFIVSEILHLVSRESGILIQKERPGRPPYAGKVRYGDIAILIRNQDDSKELENYLRAAGIPYTYSKKRGLFSSNEAYRCRQILSCINEEGSPDSFYKLLLSDLFEVRPTDLHRFDEYSVESKEKRLLESWRRYARKKEYPNLFRSLLTESLLAKSRDGEKTRDWERRITNFRQIFYLLSEQASSRNLSLRELIEYLDSCITDSSTQDEDDYLERETEEDRVKILTIHSSKGLEFPFVFLLGGFTGWSSSQRKYFEYRQTIVGADHELRSVKIIDLDKRELEKFKEYLINEDKRLYYVAVTRAMYKFYFPLLSSPAPERPLELFRRSFEAAMPNFNPMSNVAKIYPNETKTGYEVKFFTRSREDADLPEDTESEPPERQVDRDVFHWPNGCEKRTIILESYSSLDRYANVRRETGFRIETENAKSDDLEFLQPAQDDLPSSNQMGNLLHRLLETIDFSYFLYANDPLGLRDFPAWKEIKNSLRIQGYGKDEVQLEFYTERAATFLWNTLRSQLPYTQSLNCLAELSVEERKHEVDFFLRIPGRQGENANELLNGTVDFIFFSGGKYWIADWKSNKLGQPASPSSYSERNIEMKVKESYSIQLALYSLVLDGWLRDKYGPKYDPSLLGGMYFIFLRGINPLHKGSGIFFQHLDPSFMERSRSLLQDALETKYIGSEGKE
ncbi:putative exodeoxyribonuclease V, beta subunit [Leptospira inadai serovar Lyme str. 10]|uniref:RecBCD enzyme subunit RecB n=2 Tax=Leptospira inadai serovar Lyme TaxID=293084 RepID=V6H9P4_9LEPT|nr:UvrD-helicase domain-containing protein [Leptospira inadai]EQA35936.1 putative exodeoxyribonuclease V, beta subunit [Leptospira inadai serovar Lyme str. 10]PNV76873.1 exodeoxyribonuclease V subunit beta [Leptospira inadai serovar Lyme]